MRRTILLLIPSLILAQTSTFEVASIKPAPPQPPGRVSTRMDWDRQRVNFTGVSLKDVIGQAYKVQEYQIAGPDWLGSDRFDIAAKIPDGAGADQVPLMFQALLADRFKLVIHRETKELPMYALTVGKNGPKLKPAESETGISSNSTNRHWHVTATTPLARLAGFLTQRLDRPVLDRTGLEGAFDLTLDWTADDAPAADDASGPSIFTAVQEQLGLKLQATKGPVEMLIIDHAEKTPSEN